MSIATSNSAPPRLGKTVIVALLLTVALFADDVWFSFDPTAVPGAVRLFIVLPLMVFWLILVVGILVSIVRVDWRRLITRAITLLISVPVLSYGLIAAAYIHVIVMYPHYHAVIAGQTGPVSFDWGTTECVAGLAAPSQQDQWTLIYDTTGETAKKATTENHNIEETTHLLGDFFVKVETYLGC